MSELRRPDLPPQRRTQIKYALAGFVFYFLAASDFLVNYGLEFYPMGFVAILLALGIWAYAIIRHQFMDIRVVLKKSLLYSLLVTTLTVGYFGGIWLLERACQTTLGYRSIGLSLAAFALMALAFQPLKRALQRLVDRLLFHVPSEALQQRLDRLEREVRQADKLKAVATLAAGMAHEIKNPLTAIKTFTAYLPEKGQDPLFQAKFQRIVTAEAEKIHRIVRRLLDFAKPAPLQRVALSVSPLCEETLELLSSECLTRRVTVERAYAPQDVIAADPQQFRQVLLNLLLNSLEAMEAQGGLLSVSTACEPERLRVTIADTGIGIPPAHLARLREPFFTTKPTGTGLGLSVVQSIVTEHHGTFTIESEVGVGTRCTLTFPLIRVNTGALDDTTRPVAAAAS